MKMSSSSSGSRGRKSGNRKSSSNHGRSKTTEDITDVCKNMDETKLKELLEEVTKRGGNRPEHQDIGRQANVMLQQARRKIDNEEKAFPAAQSKALKTINGNQNSDLTEQRLVAAGANGDLKSSVKSTSIITSSLSLGSAGSSKASSNASDESEEADNSAASNASGDHEVYSPMAAACNGSHDENDEQETETVTAFGISPDEPVSVLLTTVDRFDKDILDANSSSGDLDCNVHAAGMDAVSVTSMFPNGLCYRPTGLIPKCGSQSDPSPDNHDYLKKKAGRKYRMQKLTKFSKKKADVPLGSSLDSKNEMYLRAFQKAADGEESEFLDRLAFFYHEQPEPVTGIPGKSDEMDSFLVGAGKNKKSSSRSKSKKDHSNHHDTDVPYRPLTNRKTDQSDSEEMDSFHGSEPEFPQETTACDIANQSEEVFSQEKSVFSFMTASNEYSDDCDVEMSPTSPLEETVREFSVYVSNELTPVQTAAPEKTGLCRVSSDSSRSSMDRMEHASGRLDGYIHEDADIDEVDKPDPSSMGGSAQNKKKKKKTKKKKSKGKSQSLTSKDSNVSSTVADERIVNYSSSAVVPSEIHSATISSSAVVVPETLSDHQSENEFQVVGPRRNAQKTSPNSKTQGFGYSAAYKHNGTGTAYRNRSTMSQSKTPTKQSASVTVPQAPIEYPQLRRRNSAGDIKKMGLEPTPVGMETAGDSSDRDSVRSMPVSKNSKKGVGKTTSAPATRLPTPGISYADIAKGTHNGHAQGSVDPVVARSVSLQEEVVTESPITVQGKDSEAPGKGVNQEKETVLQTTTLPTTVSDSAQLLAGASLEEAPVDLIVVQDAIPQAVTATAVPVINQPSDQERGSFGQPYYPDFGETTNVHTYETHSALIRTMKPAQPLAPRIGPQIYHRHDLRLPFRERPFGRHYERAGSRNRGNPRPGYHPSGYGYHYGPPNVYYRSSYGHNKSHPQNYKHGVPWTAGQVVEDSQGKMDHGTQPEPCPSGMGPESKVKEEVEVVVQKDSSETQESGLGEVLDYVETLFDEIGQKCLNGVPGYLYFRP